MTITKLLTINTDGKNFEVSGAIVGWSTYNSAANVPRIAITMEQFGYGGARYLVKYTRRANTRALEMLTKLSEIDPTATGRNIKPGRVYLSATTNALELAGVTCGLRPDASGLYQVIQAI